MGSLIDEIAKIDGLALNDVLLAVRQRYSVLYPDWEVCILSIEKSTDRNEQLDRLIAMLESRKTIS